MCPFDVDMVGYETYNYLPFFKLMTLTLTNPSGKGFETSNYVCNRHKLQSLCALMLYSKVPHVLEAELPSRSLEDILVKRDE